MKFEDLATLLTPEKLPWLTAEQMIEVDRAMVEDFGILLLQMMELAGRHLAQLARYLFAWTPSSTW